MSAEILIPEEVITSKIFHIRNQKVMLDSDLAELYQVETKQLKRQVRRNIDRFPEDFMFELSPQEFENLRSHFGTSKWGGVRYASFVGASIMLVTASWESLKRGEVGLQIRLIGF